MLSLLVDLYECIFVLVDFCWFVVMLWWLYGFIAMFSGCFNICDFTCILVVAMVSQSMRVRDRDIT